MAAFFHSRRAFRIVVGGLVLLFVLLVIVPEELVELLWMQALGYEAVYWTILRVQLLLFVVVFALVAAYLWGNFYVLLRQLPPLWASRWAHEGEAPMVGGKPLTRRRLRSFAAVVAAFFALVFAGGFAGGWEAFLRFVGDERYGLADPLFGRDAAFYMLQLPFIEVVQGTLVGLAFLSVLILATTYVLMGEIEVRGGRVLVRPSVVRHLGANLILLLAGWGWGFYLSRYELLRTPGNVVYGASHTDVHVALPALWVMIVATLGLIALVAFTMYRYRFRWLLYGAGAYALLWLGGLAVVPALVQQLAVEPNELELEQPYIEHNIAFTRAAYGLDEAEVRSYPAQTELSMADVQANEETIQNIRLWDPRLVIDTYRQLQEIRTYYQFYSVDIDRYMVDGEYREVMLAGRELTQQLPGRRDTWLNRHLVYTHGYGAVMNLVAQRGSEGSPTLLVKNLPPETEDSTLAVDEPALYYGEFTATYRIVDTAARELDYPQGDQNVYTHYQGSGGVRLDAFWRQLLFAWQFSDYNIILSDYLTPESRIQFWNRVQERIRRIAPFLALDRDPYLVLSDQRQYWIQDAYTTSRSFPYSEPVQEGRYRGTSYMRNSVKIVVDAYSGAVNFYVVDEDDPVLGVYREAFPDLFKPLSALSDDLRRHLRYPRDLFDVQVEKYARYHMIIPQVFYNNEDLWERPLEQYAGEQVTMEPYYILMRLPDEETQQFMLMTPYTPANRQNMIGWIAAKSDFPDYGELVVYELPKQRLIYGPNQVEARIDQDTEISRQLTLWDQEGSNVVRGNLIVVPIEESFLYVEPVFLIAEDLRIPQLQRVIVAYGERVAMERTLDEALAAVLEVPLATLERDALPQVPLGPRQPPAELEEARAIFRQAREALQEGDFAGFGSAFEELRRVLDGEAEAPPDTTAAAAPPGS